MKKIKYLVVVAAGLLAGMTMMVVAKAGDDFFIYAPAVFRSIPPTFTPTPTTPPPTATPTTPPPTPSPTVPVPTATPTPGTTGNIEILFIFADGAGSAEPDEYVEIKNVDDHAIQVHNWTLRDIANHVYTFPSFVMQPGKVCRVYTNQSHPVWCNFNYGSGSAIWNNSGDCATLKNANGVTVEEYCYP